MFCKCSVIYLTPSHVSTSKTFAKMFNAKTFTKKILKNFNRITLAFEICANLEVRACLMENTTQKCFRRPPATPPPVVSRPVEQKCLHVYDV